MNRKLLDIARETAGKANKAGHARVSLNRVLRSTVEWRDGKLDRLRESTGMGLGIQLFVDGRYSSNSTSDLRPEALDRFVEDTIAATRYLTRDPHRKLPNPDRYKDRTTDDLQICDEAGAKSMTPEMRREIAQEIEAAARTEEGAKYIISVSTGCSSAYSESVMVSTNGMEGKSRSTNFSFWAATSVKDEGDRRPREWWYAGCRNASDLPEPASIGREATRRALLMRGAGPVRSGRYPCIIENACAARLLGHLLRPLYGSVLQQDRSFLKDKKNQEVGSRFLDITDHPHIKKGLGSRTYDREGMSTRVRPVFEKGVLKSFYLDNYYASKMDMESTSGTSTNLVFKTGDKSAVKLMEQMGEGIFITDFSGGNSNTATGDFSIGIRGMLVENGRPSIPITEMNLAGNHLEFWKALTETGNDPYPYSSVQIPSLRFNPVQFSGI